MSRTALALVPSNVLVVGTSIVNNTVPRTAPLTTCVTLRHRETVECQPEKHKKSWQRAVAELQQLEWSEGGAKLAVEPLNRFETYFLNTAADGRRLCDEIGNPQIGILFDTFHANIEEKSMAGAIAQIGPRLTHVHLSENDRGVPGSGHIPFREVIGALRKQDYRGLAVVESFASTIREIAAATAMWRDYALSPEAFAEAAGRYLAPLLQSEQ